MRTETSRRSSTCARAGVRTTSSASPGSGSTIASTSSTLAGTAPNGASRQRRVEPEGLRSGLDAEERVRELGGVGNR